MKEPQAWPLPPLPHWWGVQQVPVLAQTWLPPHGQLIVPPQPSPCPSLWQLPAQVLGLQVQIPPAQVS